MRMPSGETTGRTQAVRAGRTEVIYSVIYSVIYLLPSPKQSEPYHRSLSEGWMMDSIRFGGSNMECGGHLLSETNLGSRSAG